MRLRLCLRVGDACRRGTRLLSGSLYCLLWLEFLSENGDGGILVLGYAGGRELGSSDGVIVRTGPLIWGDEGGRGRAV